MDAKILSEKMKRIENTLRATNLRVDQAEAADRIRACINELDAIIKILIQEEEE